MKIATLQLIVLMFVGCAHVYHAPDNAKIVKVTREIKENVTKASENQKQVAKAIKEAQDTSDEIAVISVNISGKIEDIIKIAPKELQPPLIAVKDDIDSMKLEEAALESSLIYAFQKQTEQGVTLSETQTKVTNVESYQAEYERKANDLAKVATSQSAKLAWYQLHWWGSWIVLGLGVLACVALSILKIAGKFAI